MKRMTTALCAPLCCFLTLAAQQTSDADAVLGKWLNEDKDARIEIYKEGNSYFGKIVWLKEPNEEDGTPKV